MTIYTAVGLPNLGWMVPFGVEPFGEGQNISGAKLDTISAPLAAAIDDMHDALGNVDDLGIEGHTPEFHGVFLLFRSATKPQHVAFSCNAASSGQPMKPWGIATGGSRMKLDLFYLPGRFEQINNIYYPI